MNSPILSRRAGIKNLSNKAEGIYHYIGPQNMLFRLISAGNKLASDINGAVAYFTRFAQEGQMDDVRSRSVIESVYRKVGDMMCDIDIIHAAAGAQIMPEPFECIDFCYMQEFRALLREATINGMPTDYKGKQQNPTVISLVKPGVAYCDAQPDEYDDPFFAQFVRKEESRDRKIVFRCTKSELDAIERYAHIIDVKYTEEEIHHG